MRIKKNDADLNDAIAVVKACRFGIDNRNSYGFFFGLLIERLRMSMTE